MVMLVRFDFSTVLLMKISLILHDAVLIGNVLPGYQMINHHGVMFQKNISFTLCIC